VVHFFSLYKESFLWAAVGMLLGGCHATYPTELSGFQTAYRSGGFNDAVEIAQKAQQENSRTSLVWTLECANAQRSAGKLAESVKSFEAAEDYFRDADAAADFSLSQEGLATFSNPYQIEYRGRNLDRIFGATYEALSLIELGETERARVALTRSLFRQDDARRIAQDRARLEKQEAAAISKEDTQFQARNNDARLAEARAKVHANFDKTTTYANAMNPFAVWLNGIYYLQTAEGPADLERARKSLDQASKLAPKNPFIEADLKLATESNARPNPDDGKSVVYLIHESGLAPRWSEHVVTLPLIYGDPLAPLVNLALPEISPEPRSFGLVEVSGKDLPRTPLAPLADVDGIVYAEFREEYPIARNRAIASATMKAVAGYVANKAASDNAKRRGRDPNAEFVLLATLMATNAYGTMSARADLRNWSTLPQEIQMGRFVIPKGSTLNLSGGALMGTMPCPLPKARVVLVTIRSISPQIPAIVRTSILQP
jgi:hypothetical protein